MNIGRAVAAGIMVGIGVIVNNKVENPYVGAMLFSVALLTVIKNQMHLFTGKIGYADRTYNYPVMLAANCVGVASALLVVQVPDRFTQDCLTLFITALGCGILMYLGVQSKSDVVTVFCIMTFILSGFHHCIADFPSLVVNFNQTNLVKWLVIVAGNSIGAIALRQMTKEQQ